jgi:hypothetical protein
VQMEGRKEGKEEENKEKVLDGLKNTEGKKW